MGEFPDKEIVNIFFKKSVPPVAKKKKPRKQVVLFVFAAMAAFALISITAGGHIKSILLKAENQSTGLVQTENIMRNGRIDYFKTEKIYFDGDAKEKSALLNFSAKLVNFGTSGNASLTVIFKKPLDLTRKSIFLSGKTAEGKKIIKLILKDTEGYFLEFPSMHFFPNWASRHVYLNTKNDFDLGKVKEVKIRFGSRDTGNLRGSVIYIKDIIISSSAGV